MRVGSTNISPNIGYSGRKEPWRIAVHTASNVSSIPLHNTQIAELQNKNLIRGISQDLKQGQTSTSVMAVYRIHLNQSMALHKKEESNEFCIRPLRTY